LLWGCFFKKNEKELLKNKNIFLNKISSNAQLCDVPAKREFGHRRIAGVMRCVAALLIVFSLICFTAQIAELRIMQDGSSLPRCKIQLRQSAASP
jgi:hypothetical protein